MKRPIAVAILACASAGAYAADATKDLESVHFGAPTSFSGTIDAGVARFNDIFSFTPDTPTGGVSITVVNVPLTVSSGVDFNTVLHSVTLAWAGTDDTIGTSDDTKLVGASGGAGESLAFAGEWNPLLTGLFYLSVAGLANGSRGGLYGGYIGIAGTAPIPEPETYMMLLAGFGLMGGVIQQRRQS